jgi:DNA polymerase (family X)
VYSLLGMPWIPPELREDHGEIQAALNGQLPRLITLNDIRSELHAHTNWSDGKLNIEQLGREARDRGRKILAITDHSVSLGVAGGLSVDEIKEQRKEIQAAQNALGNSIRLLQGCEVEVRADGSLDFPDEVLAELDIVLAALHSGLRQTREQVTERTVKAIQNPNVDLVVHPTGRLIPNREGAELDMDTILAEAARCQVALEINAHPSRLDLDEVYSRRAVQSGIALSINTDAHEAEELDLVHFGIATARRGWVEAKDVINTWETQKLMEWLKRHD